MKKSKKKRKLNPVYTFENFIGGELNQTAFILAKNIGRNQQNETTFYLYGGIGVGKTHLLQAIVHQALTDNKSAIYLPCDQWVNEFISHLMSQTMNIFRDKYQSYDVLIIDDIEFLRNKYQTQESLFHLITERKANQKITIAASGSPLLGLKRTDERFISLFLSGIIIKVEPLESIRRIDMLRLKSKEFKMGLDENIIEYIASMIGDNFHSVNGILSTLNLYADSMNKHITIELAQEVLENYFSKD